MGVFDYVFLSNPLGKVSSGIGKLYDTLQGIVIAIGGLMVLVGIAKTIIAVKSEANGKEIMSGVITACCGLALAGVTFYIGMFS